MDFIIKGLIVVGVIAFIVVLDIVIDPLGRRKGHKM
jgi:hypothetical protein